MKKWSNKELQEYVLQSGRTLYALVLEAADADKPTELQVALLEATEAVPHHCGWDCCGFSHFEWKNPIQRDPAR